MKLSRNLSLAMALGVSLPLAPPAHAQVESRLAFAPGQSSRLITGIVVGRQFRDYLVYGAAGQMLTVQIQRARPAVNFNILPPGSRDVAIYNSSTGGTNYSARLSQTGTYRVRVYQDRAAGMRGARNPYSMVVSVTGRPAIGVPPGAGDPPAIAGRPGSIVGITGMSAVSAIDELRARGFANVDSFSTGNTLYGIYYYRPTRLCVQTTSANSRIVDIRDIQTHPRCR